LKEAVVAYFEVFPEFAFIDQQNHGKSEDSR
jgi:hypothetical protein